MKWGPAALAASILGGAALLTVVLTLMRRHDAAALLVVAPSAAAVAAPATAVPRVALPSADVTPVPVTTKRDALPENAPPPLHLYRCIAYARLKIETTGDTGTEAVRQVLTELEAVAGPANNTERADALDTIRGQASLAGPRRDQWLDESLARCDQEIAWAHEAWNNAQS